MQAFGDVDVADSRFPGRCKRKKAAAEAAEAAAARQGAKLAVAAAEVKRQQAKKLERLCGEDWEVGLLQSAREAARLRAACEGLTVQLTILEQRLGHQERSSEEEMLRLSAERDEAVDDLAAMEKRHRDQMLGGSPAPGTPKREKFRGRPSP